MSQNTVDFSGDPTGDALLDDLLTDMQENTHTMHSGTTRPSYVKVGMLWLDATTTPWVWKQFDGTDDIIIGYADLTLNTFRPSTISSVMTPVTGAASLSAARTALGLGTMALTSTTDYYTKTEVYSKTETYTKTETIDIAGSIATLKNITLNPCFQFNTRAVSGTVVLAAGEYGHDGWRAGSGGCTYTFSTSGTVTTITITAGSLEQVIEGNEVYTNEWTLSWSGTAQGKIAGGTYGTSPVSTNAATAGSNLIIEFNTGTLTNVQVEEGAGGASAFRRNIYQTEEARCARRCLKLEASTSVTPIASGLVTNGTASNISVIVNLPNKMRASPSVSISSVSDFNVNTNSVSQTATSVNIVASGTSSLTIQAAATNNSVSGQGAFLRFRTTSGFILLEAEP